MVQTNELKAKVMDNPKLMGALWAATLLVAQAGPVVADGVNTGP
ncbi:DUF7503 family protein [Halorussus halophilus]|nr:hypothetical protein [Halorussus halophilus]